MSCSRSWARLIAEAGQLHEAERLHGRMPMWNAAAWNTIIKGYGECRQVQKAEAAFNAMAHRTVVSFTSLLVAFARNGKLDMAKHVFELMPSRDVICCNSMVAANAAAGQALEARQLFDSIPQRDVVSGNVMLKGYAQNGEGYLELATAFFRCMPQRDAVSWVTLYLYVVECGVQCSWLYKIMPMWCLASSRAMLAVHAEHADTEKALLLFQEMPQRCLITWTILLTCPVLELPRQIFDKMPCWDSVAQNAMLDFYARSGDVDEALHLFKRFVDKTVVSTTTLLKAYVKAEQVEEAVSLFMQMPTRDAVSWVTLMQAQAMQGTLKATLNMFNKMPFHGTLAYTTMVSAYACRQRVKEAKAIFDMMPEHDNASCNAMLSAYSNAETPAEFGAHSKDIFDKMASKDVSSWCSLLYVAQNAQSVFSKIPKLDIVCWNTMLVSTPDANYYFDLMPERDLCSWNILVSVHAQRGRLSGAKQTMERMPQSCLISSTSMLAAYAQAGHASQASQLLQSMVNDGICPDPVAFLCLLHASGHGGSVIPAHQAFMSMCGDHGMQAMREHYTCLIDLLARAGHLDDAEELVHSMPFVPDRFAWASILSASRSQSDVSRAERAAKHAMELDSDRGSPFVLMANVYVQDATSSV